MNFSIPRNTSYYLGLTLPLCIFFEIGSPILLATSRLAQEGAAFPLSFVFLPFFLLLQLRKLRLKGDLINVLLVTQLVFFGLTAAITIGSLAEGSTEPIPFFAQWNLFFFWTLAISASVNDPTRCSFLAKGVALGTLVNSTYISLSAILEILTYGSLQDSGRITQNLIFPGQYQIAVYTPTVVSLSTLCVLAFQGAGVLNLRGTTKAYIISTSLISVLSTGAREALLILLIGLALHFAVKSFSRLALIAVLIALISAATLTLLEDILDLMASSTIRIFQKIADLSVEGRALGARDNVIDSMLPLISDNKLLGTALTPPNTFGFSYGVTAPSAHNAYIDAFVWTGVLGGVIFLFSSLFVVVVAVLRIKNKILNPNADSLAAYFGAITLSAFLISNNINVPIRQPLTSPFFALTALIVLRTVRGRT